MSKTMDDLTRLKVACDAEAEQNRATLRHNQSHPEDLRAYTSKAFLAYATAVNCLAGEIEYVPVSKAACSAFVMQLPWHQGPCCACDRPIGEHKPLVIEFRDIAMVSGTNDAQKSPRGMIAFAEATRDPCFLFQARRWVMAECVDLSVITLDEDHEGHHDPVSYEPTTQELVDHGLVVETWETDRVFGSREESDAYGRARNASFPDGWRSYCVPCQGQLATLLVRHWVPCAWCAGERGEDESCVCTEGHDG